MKKFISLLLSAVLAINIFSIIFNTDILNVQAATYAEQLRNKGFPESYIDDLVKLHSKYPNWNFEPLKTGLNWSTAVAGERTGASGNEHHKRQLIEKNSSNNTTMYCQCSKCYQNGKYIIQEASNWVSASQEAVEHYMDPRNWLDEKSIFQFESTAYDANQTASGVEAILEGTWMHNSPIVYKDANGKEVVFKNNKKYSESIMQSAKDSGMSAYYLASKIRQEVGGAKPTAIGACGTNKTYPGIYNYYNIGAYTGGLDGLKWAATTSNGYFTKYDVNVRKQPTTESGIVKVLPADTKVTYKSLTGTQKDGYKWYCVSIDGQTGYIREDLIVHKSNDTYLRPWNEPNKSIYYGAKWIANNFKTQTSGYLQKFNVNPKSPYLYSNEYMANVAAAVSEARSTYNAYVRVGILSTPKTFSIPVFNNMPSEDAPSSTYFTNVRGIANGFELHWSKVKETTGYQVQYATRSDFANAATIYAGPTDTTSKTITGRAADTKYYVRIRTYKNVNGSYVWGSWSAADAVTTAAASAGPSATLITNISQLGGGFKLTWAKVSNADGYQIQYATRNDFANAASVNINSNATLTNSITGRANGTAYYIRIRAYKNVNSSKVWGDWSPVKSVTTPSKPASTALTSVVGIANGFTLKWNRIAEATGYQIEYATRSDFANGAIVYAGPTDTTSKTITGRAYAQNYYVRVRTYKNVGGSYVWGSWSAAQEILTYPAPASTSITSAQGISKGFQIKWNKVAETTGYQLQYATKSDFSNAATVYAGPTGATSKTITGRAVNTKYYVRIRTYKNIGGKYSWGEWSQSKSVTTA